MERMNVESVCPHINLEKKFLYFLVTQNTIFIQNASRYGLKQSRIVPYAERSFKIDNKFILCESCIMLKFYLIINQLNCKEVLQKL